MVDESGRERKRGKSERERGDGERKNNERRLKKSWPKIGGTMSLPMKVFQ